MIWIVDGNNVYGSRPDGWWNDRSRAATRLAQRVAEWCRTHTDEVVLVFDAPVAAATAELAGGNLRIVESSRRGRDAADHEIVALVSGLGHGEITVVTSDRGLTLRIVPGTMRKVGEGADAGVTVMGVGRFRELIGY